MVFKDDILAVEYTPADLAPVVAFFAIIPCVFSLRCVVVYADAAAKLLYVIGKAVFAYDNV